MTISTFGRLIGEFKEDELNGCGRFEYFNSNMIYTGDVRNHKKEGYGTKDEGSRRYIGQWKDDQRHGYGV